MRNRIRTNLMAEGANASQMVKVGGARTEIGGLTYVADRSFPHGPSL